MIYWWGERMYEGCEMWVVGAYHWGGWLYPYWKRGDGDYPVRFVFHTKYGKLVKNPKAYYYTWRELKIAFESGKFEMGKVIAEKWLRYRDSLKTEEYQYRAARKMVSDLLNKIGERDMQIEKLIKKDDKLKEYIINLEKRFKAIGIEAGKIGWRKELKNKVKKEIKDLIKFVRRKK